MTDLIKPKLTVRALVALSYFSCHLQTAYSAEVGGIVVVNYQGLFELGSGVQVIGVVSSNHRQVSHSYIRDSRTEAQR
jgi:hypothetical protein